MHKNKTPGVDGITIEHILNAHPCTISILTRLFNLMILHEYVPKNFSHSVFFQFVSEKTHIHLLALLTIEVFQSVPLSPKF